MRMCSLLACGELRGCNDASGPAPFMVWGFFLPAVLVLWTTPTQRAIIVLMKQARSLMKSRTTLSEGMFVEMVVWQVPASVPGSLHCYKYRLALVSNGQCVLRYDNEAGKGDHKHIGGAEVPYTFQDLETLLKDFREDVEKWLP